MSRPKIWRACAPLWLVCLGHVADAHHSQAMFDMAQCKSISGTVRVLQYQFPHSWLWVNVTGANGAQDVWAFEFAAPAQMREINRRWARDVMKAGDKVTVRYSPVRDGRRAGAMYSVVIPDGTELRAATPACSKLGPPLKSADRKP